MLKNVGSIAVIGASQDKSKVGHIVLKNLIKGQFTGKILPVNPKYSVIQNLKCFKDINEIEHPLDLAIFATPAQVTLDLFESVIKGKIKFAIIIASGFHNNNSKSLEDKLQNLAIEKGIRVIGPNSLGFLDVNQKINASFGKNLPKFEQISVFSQSGSLITVLTDFAQEFNMGYNKMYSLGDKIDICENDLLDFYINDPGTQVIAGYLETIKDEHEFVKQLQSTSKKIIFLKPPVTNKAKQLAKKHSGQTEQSNILKLLQKARVKVVESMEDMFFSLMACTWLTPKKFKNLKIITNASGPSTTFVNSLGNLINTTIIDIEGDATSNDYASALKANAQSNSLTLCVITPQAVTNNLEIAQTIIKLCKKNNVMALFYGGEDSEECVKLLTSHKIPSFQFLEHALEAVKAVI